MNSIRNFLIIPAVLFTAVSVFPQKDAKAKELLDKTSVMLNQSGGISTVFTLNINDEVRKIKESFEGQILLQGAKFFLDTPDQTVWFDGKTQWVYNKSIEEVNILEPQPQDIQTLNPISVFELYKTDCDYKYKGEKNDLQKRKVREVSLFPKNKKQDIRQIDIQMNAGDGMPVFFRILNKDKSEYKIFINKYQTQMSFPDSQFVFNKMKYPKAEINDLR